MTEADPHRTDVQRHHIPLVDLGRQHTALRKELLDSIGNIVDRNAFIGGDTVDAFESEFAAFCEATHCVGVANGTDALVIALKALGVGPGDEVITTAASFFASAEAVSLTGARPVFCDIELATANIDAGQIESRITSRTKAIVPVHLYGRPAAMHAILEVAQRHGLRVVEDCAQAVGARYAGKRVGTLGDIGCFSFYPSKNLGAMGDAGAIISGDAALIRRCRTMANHGGPSRYNHVMVGMNSRLDAMQAAVLGVKLPHLEAWNADRTKLATQYDLLLGDSAAETLRTPNSAESVHHLYVVRVADRDRVLDYLRQHGIGADVHFPDALPLVPAYRDLGFSPADFPNASRHAAMTLSLPIFPYMTEEEVQFVVDHLQTALAG